MQMSESSATATAHPAEHALPDHGSMPMDMSMDMSMHHGMASLFGPYPSTREASGTSWVPEASPHAALHTMRGDWDLMLHGNVVLAESDQDGKQRATKLFSENMIMGVASRQLGDGRLGFRAMLSAEPWTIGREGYPLVLQSGETADGVNVLRDRQHPHDLFMELATSYSLPLGAASSAFIYLAEPGEPALGPPAYMHRLSAEDNPETPLTHHWLDSTHISYGVVTLGWVHGDWKLEGSAFNGHEPDENRTNIEQPELNSYAFRLSWNPTPDWSLQVSSGHLASPEQLEPGVNVQRTTASAIYDWTWSGATCQSMLAFGRNDNRPGPTTNGVLLESSATWAARHEVFGRIEWLQNDELMPGVVAPIGKLSLGGVEDVLPLSFGLGGIGLVGSVGEVPGDLEPRYGKRTLYSWMAFLRFRLAAAEGHDHGSMHMTP
jgi:hypothetical protein